MEGCNLVIGMMELKGEKNQSYIYRASEVTRWLFFIRHGDDECRRTLISKDE